KYTIVPIATADTAAIGNDSIEMASTPVSDDCSTPEVFPPSIQSPLSSSSRHFASATWMVKRIHRPRDRTATLRSISSLHHIHTILLFCTNASATGTFVYHVHTTQAH